MLLSFVISQKFELNKIKAVIPNRAAARSKLEKEYYSKLKEALEPTQIILTCPINQSNFISNLIEKGKTIWDTSSSKVTSSITIYSAKAP